MQVALTKFTILTCFFFTVFTGRLNAQVFEGAAASEKLRGANLVRLSEDNGSILYVRLDGSYVIKETAVKDYLLKVFQMGSGYTLDLIRSEHDDLGQQHLRYQILYLNVPVLGSILIAHLENGHLFAFNGNVYKAGAGLNTISESACLRTALDSVHAESYLWQIPEEEAIIKDIKGDPKASWFPKGELVYVPEGLNFNGGAFQLCYRFNIHAASPRTAENIYISAADGRLVARENMLHNVDVPGKAHTKYSGVQNIITDSTAPFNFRLRENTRGNGVYTFNMKKGTNYGLAVDFTDSNNVWNNVNANKDEVATDAHWGAETTFDYFKNKFNRNSYNNNNARINSYVHYANNYDNAFWDGLRMTYGDGNSFKPLVSLDVCGHEIAHAVTSNSANLIYSYESGQLNESFSDIFGNAIERYGKPNGYSWKIGEEITSTGNGLRNMQDPRLRGHPRCYKGTNWYYGAGDNGGVHLNSGVQNWWFYLITEGGSGSNDFSNVYKVDSLGILSAEKIAYRNLTVYLTATSQYADARFYSIQSAKDLFGPCSREVIAVTNAWYACNVGPKYDSGYVKAGFSADTVVCSTNKTVQFNNLSANAISSKWYFGDGDTSSLSNPGHAYSAYGNYTIKLVVQSCFKNKKDSLTKTAYVKIDSLFDICNAILLPFNKTDSTNKCRSFVYDEGGEGYYRDNSVTYFRIHAPGADSIRIKFYDFDYELNYDSLYVYSGKFPGAGVKIGGYTGTALPFGGANFLVAGNTVTLKHKTDPGVVGRGFKLLYTAIKKPVKVTAYSDTSICNGTSVLLRATGTGGYFKDHLYQWKNIAYNDSIVVKPLASTAYKIILRDLCTNSADSATVNVTVLDPLKISVNRDTTICNGNSVSLNASGSGGNTGAHVFTWDQGLGSGAVKTAAPLNNTTYRVILSDACTPVQDTAYVRIRVKDALKVQISSNDTIICYGKNSMLKASGSGGDSMQHFYNWSSGFGIGKTVNGTLLKNTMVKVTLSDMCSSIPAVDSMLVTVRDPLTVQLGNDTNICKGTSVKLNARISGGNDTAWQIIWSPALRDTAIITVAPPVRTVYKLTIKDNCSDDASDSVVVDVMAPIQISGLKDSTICNGMQVPLQPIVTGGRSSTYAFAWNLGLGSGTSQLVAPTGNNNYRVIVTDGCTVFGDTGHANINVRGILRPKISSTDTLICYNKNSALSVSATGGEPAQYNFSWSHGLGSGTAKNINLQNDAWIKVTLSDACTVQPGTDSIFVKVRPELKLKLAADTLICKGSNVSLLAQTSGGDTGNYSYTWNQGLAPVNSHTLSPALKTLYTLQLSDNCSDSSTDSIYVDVLPALKVSGLRDSVICYGAQVNLLPVFSGGLSTQYQYTWNQGLGSAANQTVAPLSTTTYTLSLKDNCTVPYDSAKITITVRPALSLNAALDQYSLCAGDTAQLSMTFNGGVPAQYQWQLNAVPLAQMTLKVAPANGTRYIIDLSDNCSQPVSDTVNLIVNQKPVVDFSAGKTVVCRNEQVQFSNLSTGAVAYRWHLTANDSSGVFAPAFVYKTAGTYNVSLMATSDSGCTSRVEKTAYISVAELPVARFSYLPNQPDFLNRTVGFSNFSLNQNSFEWDFGDQNKETIQSSPIHTYGDTGHFPVRLIVKNSIGCADTMSEMLRVKDVFRVFIPDAITMNGDQLNDSFIVLGRGIQTYNLKIYNRWGELVYKGSMGEKPFDGRDSKGMPLMNGTYIVNLAVRDFEGFMHYVRQVLEIL